MTTLTHSRFGFCCKWLNDPEETGGMKVNAVDRDINGRSTTMRWLREHAAEADQRQWDIMNHNAAAALKMIERVGAMEPERRMVRLGSEMLQGYTEPSWINWWQRREIQDHCERIFAPVGNAARRLGVRLSFHPGQFCVLASESDEIVERSILEFEYHADMARWMGYGNTYHFVCWQANRMKSLNDPFWNSSIMQIWPGGWGMETRIMITDSRSTYISRARAALQSFFEPWADCLQRLAIS